MFEQLFPSFQGRVDAITQIFFSCTKTRPRLSRKELHIKNGIQKEIVAVRVWFNSALLFLLPAPLLSLGENQLSASLPVESSCSDFLILNLILNISTSGLRA